MRKIILPLIMLLGYYVVNAQAPVVKWIKDYGGTNADNVKSIIKTSDDNLLLFGQSSSNDVDLELIGNHGGSDFFLIEVDTASHIIMSGTYGGSNDEYVSSYYHTRAVTETSDGGFVLVGSTSSSDGDVSDSADYSDLWVVKVDNYGNIMWNKLFGTSSMFDAGISVIEDNDGNIVVLGNNGTNDGDATDNHGSYDFWIIKLSSSGNLLWKKSYGGSSQEQGKVISLASDGNYIVAGDAASGDGDVLTATRGGYDFWIFKVNSANGNILWSKTYGGSDNDRINTITLDNSGNIYLGGQSASSDGDIGSNNGNFDFFVFKLDASGAWIWGKDFGTSGSDICWGSCLDDDNNLVVIGTKGENNDNKIWLMKLDAASGDSLWSGVYDTAEAGYGIVSMGDGEYYAIADGNMIGGADYRLVKFEEETITEHSILSVANGIDVKNPVNDMLVVNNIDIKKVSRIAVYNSIGSKIYETNNIKSTMTIDLKDQPSGLYFLKINTNSEFSDVYKVVKL